MKNFKWWQLVITILVVLLLFSLSCGKGGMKGFFCNKGGDTVSVKRDTIINHDSSTVVFIPVPVKVTAPGEVKWYKEVKHDTLPPITSYDYSEPCDSTYTAAYFKTLYYDTTLKGKRWEARQKQTVTQNRIIESSFTMLTYDTTIKETVVLTQSKKIIAYFGISALSKFKDPFYGAGVSLGLKGRNDNIFMATANLSRNGMIYQGHALFPIRLFNKK